MELKFYLVLQGPDDELVIWKRPEYENYIKGVVGVGAGSAYKIITHFDPGESLINEHVTFPSITVKTEDEQDSAILLEACKRANELMAGEIERLKAENEKMRKALERADAEINSLYQENGTWGSAVLQEIREALKITQ